MRGVEEMDVENYFEYDADAIWMFGTWLDFIKGPSIRVLEVGAGIGLFTGILLQLNPKIVLTCLEPDPLFVRALKERFGKRIGIIPSSIEDMSVEPESFDVALSHIVIHNLPDVVSVLSVMKEAVQQEGHVVAIEPVYGMRSYYPSDDVAQAFGFLHEVSVFRWQRRRDTLKLTEDYNPWNRCYPQLFEKAGLVRIGCHALTSVFTLSDTRYSFAERKKWIGMRKKLLQNERARTTKDLLEMGKTNPDIDSAFSIILAYLQGLEQASEEDLSHIHEQEITNRVVTIGQKP